MRKKVLKIAEKYSQLLYLFFVLCQWDDFDIYINRR